MELKVEFIKHLTEGVLVLDERQTIVAVNAAVEKLLEHPASQLIGQTCTTQVINCHFPDPSLASCNPLCPLLNLRGSLEAEPLTFVTKSGLRREVIATTTSLPPGHSMLILQDISAAKHQERLQTEFIATASHQLRTPLASIKTSIGLLLNNVGPDFNPLLRRLLETIEVSSLRLERVVADLMELTNLLSGRVKLQPSRVEVSELIAQSLRLVQPWLDSRQQPLQVELPPQPLYVEADPGRVSQVLSHLLSNASKFSPPGSPLQLGVNTIENQNGSEPGQVVFSVSDHGIGIEASESEFIFEKFYQVQVVENNDTPGSGLGLPLAKVLVELSGGHIWFESQPGKGSTFRFSLPLAYTPHHPGAASQQE